jgi:hypothetical protein
MGDRQMIGQPTLDRKENLPRIGGGSHSKEVDRERRQAAMNSSAVAQEPVFKIV